MSGDRARRSEILDVAGERFASSGLRTSLKEIADACGILPGSLYHHFESKEAIVVELVERYRADLDRLAAEARSPSGGGDGGGRSTAERLDELGGRIAAIAERHRAAFLFTLSEPPTGAGPELVSSARKATVGIEAAIREVLRAGHAGGEVRDGIDLDALADRLFQVLLHSSLPVLGTAAGPDGVAAIRSRALRHGIARHPPSNRALDRSAAFAAAEETIRGWAADEAAEDERLPGLRAAARAEFGRRGYEATTVRDIAKAAGTSVGTVYRLVGSKDQLLASTMGTFGVVIRAGWRAVLRTDATVVEKLDALTWVDINAVERFADEYNIHLAFLRESPPVTLDVGSTFTARLTDLKSLIAKGTRSGELHVEGPTSDVRAWSLFELLWMPESIVTRLAPREALRLSRDTTLRGFATGPR